MDAQTSSASGSGVSKRGDRFAHIDGLRAIAVLAVVAFHANVPGFGGGFVGVDVFFVISGYLIINHIVDESARGRFGLLKFYARRVIRLLPPLLAMLVGSAVLGAFILISHYEWERFTLSLVTAAISGANIYFLSRQGYFDTDMWEKPLLHTWSLSVEEQFYFVVPVMIAGCFLLASATRRSPYRLLAGAAVIVFTASLAGCIWQTSSIDRNPAFYLTWWRAWEFAAGGAIGFVLGNGHRIGGQRLHQAAALAGLALIAAAIVINADNRSFPGAAALVPVAGTVLLIVTGFTVPNALVSRFLSLRIFSFIGLVSYSWYLWHWPLISFARIADFGEPSLARDLAMAALSFALAVASYRYIEVPARRWRSRHDLDRIGGRVFVRGIAACIALALVFGGAGGGMYLWMERLPANSVDSSELAEASACPPPCDLSGLTGAIVGDSHADRLYAPVSRESAQVGADTFVAKIEDAREADYAAIQMRWNPRYNSEEPAYRDGAFQAAVEGYIEDWLTAVDGPILLVGPTPEFDHKGANCIPRADRYGLDRDRCSKPRAEVDAARARTIEGLRAIADGEPRIRFADPIGLFCDAQTCRPYAEGAVLFKDDNHLVVPYGTDFFYHGLREDFWWLLHAAARDKSRDGE